MNTEKEICENPHNLQIKENLFEWIGFPESAHLHKRIPKKQFLDSGELVASDKKLFRENVKNIYWEYTLKPSTCPVLPYRDNEREYLEVAVLQLEMNPPLYTKKSGHNRVAEIIHRIIPYPLMIGFYLFTDDVDGSDGHGLENLNKKICNNPRNLRINSFALSIAPKRFSQAEHGAFVAEHFYTTGWMNGKELKDQESAFVASLAWDNMPLQTYGTLYNAWIDRFTGYECSVLSGTFTIGKTGDRLMQLTRCREIESSISELRGQLKNAAFNRQVELNTRIKKFEQELKQLAGNL